jgi:hypothetical protein
MAFKTTTVSGTCAAGDIDTTAGSLAKAINDVCAAATSVTSVHVIWFGWIAGVPNAVAVVVWKNA